MCSSHCGIRVALLLVQPASQPHQQQHSCLLEGGIQQLVCGVVLTAAANSCLLSTRRVRVSSTDTAA